MHLGESDVLEDRLGALKDTTPVFMSRISALPTMMLPRRVTEELIPVRGIGMIVQGSCRREAFVLAIR